jgi:hypothetical protein
MDSYEYVDVDAILAGDERVKCTFKTEVLEGGYLDPSCRCGWRRL